MKKVIGILGVAVIAATMFFSASIVSDSKSDTSLASLMNINNANAEDDICISCGLVSTDVCITVNYHVYVGYRVITSC